MTFDTSASGRNRPARPDVVPAALRGIRAGVIPRPRLRLLHKGPWRGHWRCECSQGVVGYAGKPYYAFYNWAAWWIA